MKKKQLLSWIPVILCMAVIFSFSAQDGTSSGQTSAGVMALLDPLVEPLYQHLSPSEQAEFLDAFHHLIRKTAHFSIYFLLGLFSCLAFGTYALSPKKRFGFALLLSFAYACSDEWHQSFVAGRGPSFTDVLIDTAGAALACLILWGIHRLRQSKGKKS